MSDRLFLFLTWPGLPVVAAAVLVTAAGLWLRVKEDRDVTRYRQQVDGRAALARAAAGKENPR